jgi:hypothetical protein
MRHKIAALVIACAVCSAAHADMYTSGHVVGALQITGSPCTFFQFDSAPSTWYALNLQGDPTGPQADARFMAAFISGARVVYWQQTAQACGFPAVSEPGLYR